MRWLLAGFAVGAVVLVVLVATAAAYAQGLPPFDTARLYPDEASFRAALKPYLDAVAANPRNAEAYYWLAVAYHHAYRLYRFGLAEYGAQALPRAIDAAGRAVAADPRLLPAWKILVEVYSLAGDSERARWATEELMNVGRQGPSPGP